MRLHTPSNLTSPSAGSCIVGRALRRVSRSQSPLGLVLLDVNRLKHVNDMFGHEAGDKLLQPSAGSYSGTRGRTTSSAASVATSL